MLKSAFFSIKSLRHYDVIVRQWRHYWPFWGLRSKVLCKLHIMAKFHCITLSRSKVMLKTIFASPLLEGGGVSQIFSLQKAISSDLLLQITWNFQRMLKGADALYSNWFRLILLTIMAENYAEVSIFHYYVIMTSYF